MSARMGDAIGVNVNRNGRGGGRMGDSLAYKSGVSTGKGKLTFDQGCANPPDPSFFDKANQAANDGRSRKNPR